MPNITARDVASILSLNPYETAWQCMENKIERKYPFFGNKFTEHGNKYEKTAISIYEKFTGNEVDTTQINRKHPEYTWLTGRIDGMTHNNCIVEVKCPWVKRKDTLTVNNVPPQYWVQCQVYMNIYDSEITHYVEYNVDPNSPTDGTAGELSYIPIIRDRLWWDENIPKIERFYNEMIIWHASRSLNEHSIRIEENKWSSNFQ